MVVARPGMRQGAEGSVRPPFPLVAKSLGGLPRDEFVAMADAAPLVDVPMHALRATQRGVDPREVEAFRRNPPHVAEGKRNRHGLLVDHPLVVKRDGKLELYDGHHRATAAKLRGDTRILVRLVDLDARRSARSGGLASWARARAAS